MKNRRDVLFFFLVALTGSTTMAQQAPVEAPFNCGLDAAYLLLNRTGHHAAYDVLIHDFLMERPPDSLLAIRNVLKKHGCAVVGVHADAAFFLTHEGPAIVYFQLSGYSPKNENHFSYLVKASRDRVELLDPLFSLNGRSALSWDAFNRVYQNMALILKG